MAIWTRQNRYSSHLVQLEEGKNFSSQSFKQMLWSSSSIVTLRMTRANYWQDTLLSWSSTLEYIIYRPHWQISPQKYRSSCHVTCTHQPDSSRVVMLKSFIDRESDTETGEEVEEMDPVDSCNGDTESVEREKACTVAEYHSIWSAS